LKNDGKWVQNKGDDQGLKKIKFQMHILPKVMNLLEFQFKFKGLGHGVVKAGSKGCKSWPKGWKSTTNGSLNEEKICPIRRPKKDGHKRAWTPHFSLVSSHL
jgi:hypothetical protein